MDPSPSARCDGECIRVVQKKNFFYSCNVSAVFPMRFFVLNNMVLFVLPRSCVFNSPIVDLCRNVFAHFPLGTICDSVSKEDKYVKLQLF